jgi:hypothetical protein
MPSSLALSSGLIGTDSSAFVEGTASTGAGGSRTSVPVAACAAGSGAVSAAAGWVDPSGDGEAGISSDWSVIGGLLLVWRGARRWSGS